MGALVPAVRVSYDDSSGLWELRCLGVFGVSGFGV